MKKLKWFILPLILGSYASLYIATQYEKFCEGDCAKMMELHEALRLNREDYFRSVQRPIYATQSSDSLCVYVKDTLGINWNLFADTVCQLATDKGLLHQKIFILNDFVYPPDTLARKICP